MIMTAFSDSAVRGFSDREQAGLDERVLLLRRHGKNFFL